MRLRAISSGQVPAFSRTDAVERALGRAPAITAERAARRYQIGYRPRCLVCDRELEPCGAARDGEPCYVGFHPCPDHPGCGLIYPEIP